MDLRGHGESGGVRGDAKNFEEFFSDLDCLVKHIRGKYPDKKIVLFGHSFGGQVSLVYSAKQDVDGLILTNPLLTQPQKSKFLKLVPHKLFGFIKLKKKHSESIEMLEVSRKDPLACKKFSLRLVGIMFKDGIDKVNENISNVKCSTFVAAGKLDPLVDCASTELAFQKLSSVNKKLRIYDNVKHRIVQNEGCEERINEIVDWVNSI
jgi:alpha-beta hydrolase superfamily lysophospholipase